MLSLEDTAQTYALTSPGKRMSFLLFEQVFEAVRQALQERHETVRVQTPAVFGKQPPDFVQQHSMTGRLAEIFPTPQFPAHLDWLRSDPVVNRYSKIHPEVLLILDQWAQAARPYPKADA
jgi:hypothetical protein